jgi:sugar/nucleoside kinase (ribokinase family)
MLLEQYHPKSQLVTRTTLVHRPRFPVIDAHNHLGEAFGGVCGDDVFGRFMLEEMQKRGIDTSRVIIDPNRATGLSVILNQSSDRAILTFAGLIPALQTSDIPGTLLRQACHLHVASYFLQTNLQAGLPALFQQAHSFGLTASLDTNYDPSEEWPPLEDLLSVTDVFLPNRTEALAITRSSNVKVASMKLARKAGLVAIKLCAAGALACQAGSVTRSDSIQVHVVDSVGAGDTFDAGLLFGYLNHWNLERSLRLACVCGALSMRKAGGTDGQPTLQEALKYVPG